MKSELHDLFEQVLNNTDKEQPSEVAEVILNSLDSGQYKAALSVTLPRYVQYLMAERRRSTIPESPDEPERYAPDDLLSETGQEQQRTLLKARGSARVNSIRTEWQRHFADRVWNGERYKAFGEFTEADLRGAAGSLRSQADAFVGKAERYEKIAAALGPGQTVSDLDSDPMGE